MDILFYHLEYTDIFAILPTLLAKCCERGWRSVVLTGAESPSERLEALDRHLWTYQEDSFLPHSCVIDPSQLDEVIGHGEQIILTAAMDARIKARWQAGPPPQALFLIDHASMGDMGEMAAFERCIVLFEGEQDASLARAQADCTAARVQGHEMTYWRRSNQGGWAKQALPEN